MKLLRTLCLLLVSCVVFSSCSHSSNAVAPEYEECHIEQFVEDSAIIQQGKMAIMLWEGKEPQPFRVEDMEEYTDTIEENDVLLIRLFHPQVTDVALALQEMDELGFRVIDGEVLLPGVSPIRVLGLTLREARGRIQSAYSEQIEGVEVFIDYRDRLSRKVEIIGMSQVPAIPVDGKKRLYEVLAEAQISPSANLFASFVMREGAILSIDLNKLLREGDLSRNIVMRGGDKIYLAREDEAYVMVMGEVMQPQAVPTPFGKISLRDALVSSGGISATGDLESILIIRGSIQTPKLYLLNWRQVLQAPNNKLLLMPGDTVLISARAITKWNRFIDQLFPSFSGLLTLGQIKKVVNKNN